MGTEWGGEDWSVRKADRAIFLLTLAFLLFVTGVLVGARVTDQPQQCECVEVTE